MMITLNEIGNTGGTDFGAKIVVSVAYAEFNEGLGPLVQKSSMGDGGFFFPSIRSGEALALWSKIHQTFHCP